MARAEMPRAPQVDDAAQRPNAILHLPVFLKSERDRVNAFLNRDEFCFNV